MSNHVSKTGFAFGLLSIAGLASIFGQNSTPVPPDGNRRTPGKGIALSADFGHVDSGKSVLQKYLVRNPSPAPLRLIDSRASCGCVTVASRPAVIDADSSAEVVLELHTEGIERGRVEQTVVFKTEHPEYEYIRLQLTGAVDGIWARPKRLDLGTVTNGSPKSHGFFVVESGRPLAEVKAASIDAPGLTVAVEPAHTTAVTTSHGIRAVRWIEVNWNGKEAPLGSVHTHVKIATNDPVTPHIHVPVSVHVAGAAKLLPSPVVFGRVRPGDHVERTCRVEFKSPQAFDSSELTFRSGYENLRCNVEHGASRQSGVIMLRMVFTGQPVDNNQLLRGEVSAIHKEMQVLSIPFIAYVTTR